MKKFILFTLFLAFVAGIYIVVHTFHIEPFWFKLINAEIALDDAQKPVSPVKILFLSDIHAGDKVPFPEIDRAFEIAIKQKPDLILLGGDFVTGAVPDSEIYGKLLRKLSAAAPAFACMGNHDGGKWTLEMGGLPDCSEIRKLLVENGITPLENKSADIGIKNCKLRIVGLGDLWAGNMLPGKAFDKDATDNVYVIVLSHNPDSKDELIKYKWNLMLCGHTHGGQCAIPFIGPPLLPVSDRAFSEGLHEWNGRKIYVSRGVGNLCGGRFNCRPEITLITLK